MDRDSSGIRWSVSHDLAYVIIRLTVGAIFVFHGSQKLLGWFGGKGPADFVSGLAQMGIPAFLAWLAIIAEFFGGLGLIAGVLPRLSSLGIIIVMLVAIFKVHLPQGDKVELHLLVIAGSLLVLLTGPGRWTVLPDFEKKLLGGSR